MIGLEDVSVGDRVTVRISGRVFDATIKEIHPDIWQGKAGLDLADVSKWQFSWCYLDQVEEVLGE